LIIVFFLLICGFGLALLFTELQQQPDPSLSVNPIRGPAAFVASTSVFFERGGVILLLEYAWEHPIECLTLGAPILFVRKKDCLLRSMNLLHSQLVHSLAHELAASPEAAKEGSWGRPTMAMRGKLML
jgi:hypothetical protein